MRILIAASGSIFFGDDAFGPEVVRLLGLRFMPREVELRDFGIRGYDVACALTDGHDAVILVDATPRGSSPGTLCLIEPDLESPAINENEDFDGHSLDPVRVLQMAKLFGSVSARLFLVGCEPDNSGGEEGAFGLSQSVEEAVPKAADLIESLVSKLRNSEPILAPYRAAA